MEASATAKFMRVSPRKARLVVDLIRGKKISEAKTILSLANKASAATVKKVLDSAIANAGQTGVIDVGTLYVKSACVNVGASQKRFRPAPLGRGHKDKRGTRDTTIMGGGGKKGGEGGGGGVLGEKTPPLWVLGGEQQPRAPPFGPQKRIPRPNSRRT